MTGPVCVCGHAIREHSHDGSCNACGAAATRCARNTGLCQQQVDELPDGARIWVKWTGGNGPHRYRVRVDEWGNRWTQESQDVLSDVGDYPLTQVWADA